MFEQFPYANFHEMNMDWVIKVVKDFLDKYEYIEELIETGKTDIVNLTNEELQVLTDKKNELEALLQAWYDSHSQDIAQELTEALAEAISAFNTAADNKAAQTIASIPADYTTLSNNVTNLRDEITDFKGAVFLAEQAVRIGALIENGYINPATGSNGADDTKYTRTGFIKSAIPLLFRFTDPDYEYCIWTYRGATASSHEASPTGKAFVSGEFPLIIPAGSSNNFRICFRRRDLANLTTDTADPTSDFYKIQHSYAFYVFTDTTVSLSGVPADAKAVGDIFGTIDAQRAFVFNHPFNLGTLVVNGAINPETGANESDSPKRTRTNYIKEASTILFSLNDPDYEYCIWTYTSPSTSSKESNPTNGVFTSDPVIIAPAGGSHRVRFCFKRKDNADLTTDTTDPTSDYYRILHSVVCYSSVDSLASSNDTTDRTDEIQNILSTKGVCKLGAGVFYTSGITMPDNTMIEGIGKGTQIILIDSSENPATCITLGSGCTVKNVDIAGSLTDITPSSTLGARNGIGYIGTGSNTISKGIVTNCFIHGFDGSGIYADNTGYGVDDGLNISNCYIYNCGAGINFWFLAEYNKISNCMVIDNYYGYINNGGNNIASNCGFDENSIGFYLDNSDGTKLNNAHGSIEGSTFHHNTLWSIQMIGVSNAGFMFTGNSIGKGISLDRIGRISFSGCRISKDFTLIINSGWLVLFSGCNFVHDSDGSKTYFNITSDKVRFNGCYDDNGNEVNQNTYPVTPEP